MTRQAVYELTEESEALLRYAAGSGLDIDAEILAKVASALARRKEQGDQAPTETWNELLAQYAALVRKTKPVSGRTLLETRYKSRRILFRLLIVTLIFLAIAVINEGLGVSLIELPEPEEGCLRFLFDLRQSFLEFLSPFIWGALGSCVFLMKRLYDYAEERQFDSESVQGWTVRILLGAILGAVVAHVYDVSTLGGDEGALAADALAFFTGVGVKVIYGAIERTIEALAARMGLDAVRRVRPRPDDAIDALTRKLAETDKDKEPERLRALQELVKELQGKP